MWITLRSLQRWLVPIILVVLGALCAVPHTAIAEPTTEGATLSLLSPRPDAIVGTLTLRGAPGPVDPDSVSVTIGGRDVAAEVSSGAEVPRSTMLVIDTSGSMGAEGMQIVRNATRDFLKDLPEDVAVGVVSFASTAGVDLAPTTDRDAVLEWVDGLTPGGYTALYQAVTLAVESLGDEGERSIVLLSDGGDTVAERDGGPSAAAAQRAAAADAVRTAGIRVEVVAFKESNEARDDVVAEFARVGGGSVADAADAAAVTTAFQSAARALSTQVVITAARPDRLSGSQPVVVTGIAGGLAFRATAIADLATGTADPTPPGATPQEVPGIADSADSVARGPVSAASLLFAVLAMFVGMFVLVLAVASPSLRSAKSQRLDAIEQFRPGRVRTRAESRASEQHSVATQLVGASERLMASRESTGRTLALIERADLPLRAGEWLLLRIVCVLAGGTLGYVLSGSSLIGLAVGFALGLLVPPLVLRFLAARRARRFEQVLPDVMMLVATSLSSGFSLIQALDAVAKDAPEPADKEFARALAQARIGADVSDALDTVAQRMDSENMRWTTMAIRIQREVGGNLAETLRTTAATLRERGYLRRQVRALSAEGRLSAYVLIVLPIGLMAYMTIVNFDYVSLLWTRALGIMMLIVAFILLVVGIFWMRKVVQIEV